jgi:cytochrome c oxidase subunit 3
MNAAVLADDDAAADAPVPDRAAGEFGMWIFIASEMLFFGALLLTYAWGRVYFPEGFAAAGHHTDVLLGTVNTAVLLTSSLLVAVAAAAASARRPGLAGALLAGTALLGIVFLGIKAIEYHHEWQQALFPGSAFRLDGAAAVPAGAQLFFVFYFVATGLHALHVAGGIGLMATTAWGQWREAPEATPERVHLAGLYWHFVDVVWVLLYPLLYLVGRNG